MKQEYLSRNLSSAVVAANKILARDFPGAKIIVESTGGKMAVYDVDELEESIQNRERGKSRLFENKQVEKTLYWLEMLDECHGKIKGVHFAKDMTELGETVEFAVEKESV